MFKLSFADKKTFEKAYDIAFYQYMHGFEAWHSDMVLSFFKKEYRDKMSGLLNVLKLKHTVDNG